MTPTTQVVLIMVIAAVCQVAAWRIGAPSIVFLLLAGVLCGPYLELIKPDELFGEFLNPLVSLSVALVLFEGGMTLEARDVGKVGRLVLLLITLGAIVNWAILSVAAYLVFDMSATTATLIGAILIVSGPTVVIPLLRNIRPRAPLGSILHWEGILIDPIGVVIAVIVAEIVTVGPDLSAPFRILSGLGISMLAGAACGLLGGIAVRSVLSRYLLPDHLNLPFVIAVLFLAVFVSDSVHHDAGLLAATVLGTYIAWKGGASWGRHIEEFTSQLQVFLVSILFIVLSARLKLEYLDTIGLDILMFLVVVIFLARPISVALSTVGSGLGIRERVLLAGVMPRGIVAASLASALGLSAEAAGAQDASMIVSVVFLVIIGTVLWYGFLSPVLCSLLGLRLEHPQGAVIVGAHAFGRALGSEMKAQGFRALLIDTNAGNIARAMVESLETHLGSAYSDSVHEELDLERIGRVVSLTANDEANALAVLEFRNVFGTKEGYQLAPSTAATGQGSGARGRILWSSAMTYAEIDKRWREGHRVRTVEIADVAQEDTVLATIDQKNNLTFATEEAASPPPSAVKAIVFGA